MSQTKAQLLEDSLGNASTGTVPIGCIILWSGFVESIPGGYVLCNGAAYNRTTYDKLFDAIGTIHGGSGNNFNVPNLRNRFIVGAGSGYAVAATGGSANATLVSHSHNFSVNPDEAELSTKTQSSVSLAYGVSENNETVDEEGGEPTQVLEEVKTKNSSISIINSGSSASNANLPPYYALAYIIRLS